MHDGRRGLGLTRNQTFPGKREFPVLLWPVFFTWGHNFILSPMDFTDNIPDDTSVIRNTLRGNINSFEILIDRYQDYVARIVMNHVPRDDAPEVAHDTFVQAYQSLGGFQGTGPFKPRLCSSLGQHNSEKVFGTSCPEKIPQSFCS